MGSSTSHPPILDLEEDAEMTSSIESDICFFANTSRRRAELLLMESGKPRGCFLIRNSQREPKSFSLCVKDNDDARGHHVKHYKIKPHGEGKGYYIDSHPWKFPSLRALVVFYTEIAVGMVHNMTISCPTERTELWDLSSKKNNQWGQLEIDRNEITFKKKLGAGFFGEVWLGSWQNKLVAVKQPKPKRMTNREFLEEAAIMKKLCHFGVVALYAVCTKQEPILIVQEFMRNGSLLNYLGTPAGRALSVSNLGYMASQIANGMDYLEKLKIIHVDLAARNILVGENNTVKISDFGLARLFQNHYEYGAPEGDGYPKRWSAPEVLFGGESITNKADVWSYGILLMEMYTYGQEPYLGMTDDEVKSALFRRYRMPKPIFLPNEIYQVMMKCWDQDPEERPFFQYLRNFFCD